MIISRQCVRYEKRDSHNVCTNLRASRAIPPCLAALVVSSLSSIWGPLVWKEQICQYRQRLEFVWWAWTNFSWFASSFDTDDWLYRLLTFVQMFGVLVLAAGIEPLFASFDARLAASGYVIMRVAIVGQWSRASLSPHWHSKTQMHSNSQHGNAQHGNAQHGNSQHSNPAHRSRSTNHPQG